MHKTAFKGVLTNLKTLLKNYVSQCKKKDENSKQAKDTCDGSKYGNMKKILYNIISPQRNGY